MRLRYSIRWLLIATLVLAIGLGYVGNEIQAGRRRAAVYTELQQNPTCTFALEGYSSDSAWILTTWNRLTGSQLPRPYRVAAVSSRVGQVVEPRDLEPFFALTELKSCYFDGEFSSAVFTRMECTATLQELSWKRGPTDAAVRELKRFQQLNCLTLAGQQLSDACVDDLVELRNLKILRIDQHDFAPAAVTVLPRLPLWSLWLPDTQVTDAGLAALAQMRPLVELECDQRLVTSAGLLQLLQLPSLALYVNDTAPAEVQAHLTANLEQLYRRLERVDGHSYYCTLGPRDLLELAAWEATQPPERAP